MIFHTATFGVFLLANLILFWSLARHRTARNVLLLVSSLVFYGASELWYLGLLAFSTLLDWHCGNVIASTSVQRTKKLALIASLVGNLGLLTFFKAWDWGVRGVQDALSWVGLEVSLPLLEMAVPVGISFYTFQTLSYTIDIYRGRIPPARSLLDFALFVSFFPQLVAGPIVRAREFLPQLELVPSVDRARFHEGLYRLGVGLAKKVLVADVLGYYLIDPVYARPEAYAPLLHALAWYAFTFQIYFDFSGYTDIAIGCAKLFGFELPENFRGPYRSRSIREFWRRWHMTLSFWLRDYVYFPLGGSKGSEVRVAFNLVFVMVLIGLWHDVTWRWVVFGLLHSGAMILERWLERRRGGRLFATTLPRQLCAWFMTYHFCVLTYILVRARDFGQVADVVVHYGDSYALSPWGFVALAVAFGSHALPQDTVDRFRLDVCKLPTPVLGALLGLLVGCLAIVLTEATPFFYFQF